MDNNLDRAKDLKERLTYEEIAATQAAEQMMRDLFIEFWIEFLDEIKDQKIEPNMALDFKGKKIYPNEHEALGLTIMQNQIKKA